MNFLIYIYLKRATEGCLHNSYRYSSFYFMAFLVFSQKLYMKYSRGVNSRAALIKKVSLIEGRHHAICSELFHSVHLNLSRQYAPCY